MTVRELRKALQGVKGDALVFVTIDSADCREVVDVVRDEPPTSLMRSLGETERTVYLTLEE